MPILRTESSALWPDALAELLLQAALDSSPKALDAFIGWKIARGLTQYSEVDFASTRLLPLVYRNLIRQQLTDSWLPQMSGLSRYHWLRNARAQRQLLRVIEPLVANGASGVVLGGLAMLAAGYLDNAGERPALLGEILIGPDQAASLRKLLASQGWSAVSRVPPVSGWRSERWNGPDRAMLEIHYRWLPKPYPFVGVARLIEHAQLVEWHGVSFHVPDAADQLLHACVCNRRVICDGSAPFVWVADAMRILTHGEANIDWRRLHNESQALQTMHAVSQSLEYLHTQFGASVSEEFLRQTKYSRYETRLLARASRQKMDWSWAGFTDWLGRPWHDYAAADRAANRGFSIRSFLAYWKWRGECEFVRHLTQRAESGASPTSLYSQQAKAA